MIIINFFFFFPVRYERYERALLKGHKESLDRGDSKENIDIDSQKYKAQVMQLMEDGNKLRFVNKKKKKNSPLEFY